MTVAFFGHSKYIEKETDEKKLLEFLKARVGSTPCEFFLGGYGSFDNFCCHITRKFKEEHEGAKRIFITPYNRDEYLERRSAELWDFDEIIYPELENVPPKFAISRRNRWMVKRADLIIVYVNHKHGGAYQAYKYAMSLGKEIFNLYYSID